MLQRKPFIVYRTGGKSDSCSRLKNLLHDGKLKAEHEQNQGFLTYCGGNLFALLDEEGNPIKGIPRHPIIGDNVVIYSNASILGRITIGANAVIGGNIWVTENVAEGEKLVQAKANNFLRFKQ